MHTISFQHNKTTPHPNPIHKVAIASALGLALCGLSGCAGAPSGSTSAMQPGTKIAENALSSTVVGSYTVDGTSTNITAQDVYSKLGGAAGWQESDGTWDVPSAESILTYVRTITLEKEAQKEGISVSDEEVKEYYAEMSGGSDNITDKDLSSESIRSMLTVSKLQNSVTNGAADEESPADVPSAGDDVTKEYADYIISLAGDEWDATAGTWKNQDGDFAKALAGLEMSASGASRAAAQAAWNVAMDKYSSRLGDSYSKWIEYQNRVLDPISINIKSAHA